VDQQIGVLGQGVDTIARTGVAGVYKHTLVGFHPEAECLNDTRLVVNGANSDLPVFAFNHLFIADRDDFGCGTQSGQDATAYLEDLLAAGRLGTARQIDVIDAAFVKQQFGHALQSLGAVNRQIWDLSCALIPPTVNKSAIVQTMVAMQMREEDGIDIGNALAGLDEPVIGASSVVKGDQFVANFDQIPGACLVHHWRWTAGAEECYFHSFSPGFLMVLSDLFGFLQSSHTQRDRHKPHQ
jgi:hypothetical protein